MTMHSRRSLVAVLVCLLITLTGVANADSGSADDPDDTTGPLDISRVSHTNDGASITYRLETYERFTLDDVRLVRWDFDLDGDGIPAEACIIVTRLGSTRTLRGGFFGECGPETWATADARLVDGNAMEITFPILDLVEGGGLPPGSDYSYRVTTRDRDRNEDTAPDGALAEHRGVPKVLPREGSADTLFGNPGTGVGVGVAGRTQHPAAEAGEGGSVPGSGSAGGFLGSVPIIGNLCSGALCLLIGIGAPVAVIAIGWAALLAYRARRRPGEPPMEDPPLIAPTGVRSHPGHMWFAPPSSSADSVGSLPNPGSGTGHQDKHAR